MEKKVLVIDNAVSGWNRCSALAEHGYSVEFARDPDAGLRKLSSHCHDVIIVEENPGSESWQLCERIRHLSARPLMVISPDASAESSVKAIRAGADYFMRRPLGPLELSARVGSLLRRAAASPAQIESHLSI